MAFRLGLLGNSRDRVESKLALMERMAELDRAHPQLRRLVIQLLPHENRAIPRLEALFQWARRNLKFVADPPEIEYIARPIVTLWMGGGDCDDLATLAAAMLQAAGFQTRFALATRNGQTSHVYVEVLPSARLATSLAFDLTEPALGLRRVST